MYVCMYVCILRMPGLNAKYPLVDQPSHTLPKRMCGCGFPSCKSIFPQEKLVMANSKLSGNFNLSHRFTHLEKKKSDRKKCR